MTGPQARPALPRTTRRPRRGAGAWRRLNSWATERRWDAGTRPTGQTRGPMNEPEANAVIPVRVTREVQTVELLATPEQIARTGLTHPGGETTGNEIDTPGATPGGWTEVGVALMRLAMAIEAWLVWVLQKLFVAGAMHPRLVLWGAVLWGLAQVTS